MPTLVNESVASLQYAESQLALAEADVAMKAAENDLAVAQRQYSQVNERLGDTQFRRRELFASAVKEAPTGISPENIVDYSSLQVAVEIYFRIAEHYRCFRLGNATVTHLEALANYRAATLAAERTRRDARESEILSDLSRVRTGGAPLEADLKNLLSPHDRLILHCENDLAFAQEQLRTAREEVLTDQRAYVERFEK